MSYTFYGEIPSNISATPPQPIRRRAVAATKWLVIAIFAVESEVLPLIMHHLSFYNALRFFENQLSGCSEANGLGSLSITDPEQGRTAE